MKKVVTLVVVLISLISMTISCGEKVEEAEKRVTPTTDPPIESIKGVVETIPLPEMTAEQHNALPGHRYYSTFGGMISGGEPNNPITWHMDYGVDSYREFSTNGNPKISTPSIPSAWDTYINKSGGRFFTANLWHPRDVVVYHFIRPKGGVPAYSNLKICLKDSVKPKTGQGTKFSVFISNDYKPNVNNIPAHHDYNNYTYIGTNAFSGWARLTPTAGELATDYDSTGNWPTPFSYPLSGIVGFDGSKPFFVAIIVEGEKGKPFDNNIEIAWISVQ